MLSFTIRPACQTRHTSRLHTPCLHSTTSLTTISLQRHQRQRTRRAPVSINALSANDVLGVSGTAVLTTVLLAAVGYSALPLLRQRRTSEPAPDPGDINDQDIKWTVMGIISCLPFVNWTAWIFAALDDPDAASRYYLFAALYALPLLTEGLSLDAVLLGATALCALHVQVERVAAQAGDGTPLLDDDAITRAPQVQQKQLETDRAARDALPVSKPREAAARGAPLEDPRRRDELQALIDKQLQEFDSRLEPGKAPLQEEDGAATQQRSTPPRR